MSSKVAGIKGVQIGPGAIPVTLIPSGKTGKIKNIYKAINFIINSDYTNNAYINIDGGYR